MDGAGATLFSYSVIGGSDKDVVNDIAVDVSGNVYMTGYASSTDFPIAAPSGGEPFQRTLGGGIDAFVTEVNAAGSVK